VVELLSQPPPAEAIARMSAIEGVQITPAMLATQQGPDGRLGPEAAGAVLLLQATFVDEDRLAAFFAQAATLMEQLATARGFIRRYTFADGPHYTLIALWRSVADAHTFFASEEHRAAMDELFRHRWQYTHFAALWELVAPRDRVVFCQHCDGITPTSEQVCRGCGVELFDPYASPSHAAR
jgi:heme-degrading monooxygenase HmoA